MRRLTALLSAAMLLSSLLLALSAPTVAAACSNIKITAHEDPNQRDTGGTEPLVYCYPYGVSDLRPVQVPADFKCNSLFVQHNTWDNCISSFTIAGGGYSGGCYHYGVSLWIDYNYTNLWGSYWGPKTFNGGPGLEDQISSISFKYRATCPSAPAP